jgi:hypothetical protein
MNEEKMDEMIRRAAASYNSPPANVPREEMWSAVKAARTAGPRIVYGSAPRTTSAISHMSTRVWLGAAAAAALLVIAGIGVGRWSAPKAPAPVVASLTGKIPAPTTPNVDGGASTETPNQNAGSSPVTSPVRVAQGGSSGGRSVDTGAHVRYVTPDRGSNSAYQLVTLTHLSDAEAMLTSFRSQTDEKLDAAMAKWARDLLTNTRLLLDSPAASDPRRRQLLEDLELTLVDIVQLSPGSGAQDRQMIEKNLDQGHVLTRLRSAIPAGQKGS